MALATRQRRPGLPSDLPPSSPAYTKFDKKPAARSDGGGAPEDDRGLGWFMPLFALGMLRYMSATSNIVHDCDEVFNYWEPLHYLLYKSGFQTWEYSSQFALRSYLYIIFHELVGQPASWLYAEDKVRVFYAVRIFLGLLSVIADSVLVVALSRKYGKRLASYALAMLCLTSGCFFASTSFLPSSFSMYAMSLSSGLFLLEKPAMAVAVSAVGVILGWPFSILAFLPVVFYSLARRFKQVFVAGAVTSLALLALSVYVDYLYYKRWTSSVLNLLVYNVLGGGESHLYGTEGPLYYLRNGFNNFNFGFVLASKLSEFSLVDLPRLQHVWKKNDPQVLGFRNLKLMKVDNCRSLKYIFTPSVAFGLVQLQELEIKNCAIVEAIIVIEEERIANTLFPNLNRVELDDLPKLTSVCNLGGNSIKLPSLAELLIQNCPNMQTFNSNTTSADMAASNVQPNVQPFFDDKVGLPYLKFLRIKHMDNLTKIWDNKLTVDSSLALENLSLIGCNKLLNVFPSSMLGRLQKLKELLVSECDSLEVIFEELTKKDVEGVPSFVFPQLTYLELVHLPRLKRFYPGLYISKWPMLKKLRVWRCDKEMILTSDPSLQEILTGENQSMFLVYKAAFPNLEELSLDWNCIVKEMLKGNFSKYSHKLKVLELIDVSKENAICPCCFLYTLPNLEKLEVTCGLLKEMFVCGCKEKPVEAPSKLRQLMLFNLKDSLHKWEENSLPCKVFQNLATLELSECGNLQQLVPSFVSFQNLTTLEVTKCNGLLNVMTVSTAKSLVQLSKMNISECKMLEGIITHVGDEVETPIIFSQLKYLVLHCLPSLTSFYSGNHTIEFPSLQQAIVRQCPSMKIFSHSVLSTPRLHRLQITEEVDHKGSWEGSLNMTIKKLFHDMVGFCGIEYLTLSEFPHLKEVWDDQFPARFFSNLKSLVMDECTNILKAISGYLLQCLNSLETLDVRSCDLLQEVFDLEELNADGHLEVLSKLSEFSLVDLPRLQHIWKKNHPQVLGFRNLKLMTVDKCSSLKYVFTPSVAMGLEQLQQLKIKNCVMVEAIIVIKEKGIGNTLFPNLKRLGIKDLPKLRGFCDLAGNSIKLPSLAELQIQNCPNMQTFNSNFTSAAISASNENLHTNMQPFFDEKVGLPKLKFLRIDKMHKLRKIWHDDQLMSTSFCELEYFKVVNCNKLLNVFPYNMFGRLGRLEKLWISKCDSLEEIFDLQAFSSGKSQAIAATQLRELVLHYLPNLKHVWNMESQCLLSFQNLLYLEVEGLDSLKSVFPVSIAKGPLQLEELRINKCSMVEDIVAKEEVNEVLPTFEFPKLTLLELCELSRLKSFYPELYISKWPVLKKLLLCKCDEVTVLASEFQENNNGESQNEIPIRQPMFLTDQDAFPNLKKLYLFELPQLLHLWKENSQNSRVFEKLTSLDVSDCDNLKTLVPSWMSLQSLTTLEVWRCNGLMNLMTLSTAKTLVQLAKMDIFECKMLEEIIVDDQGDEAKDGIVLNQLKILKLDSLPSLTSFFMGKFTIEFPSLEQVCAIECLNMKTFSGGILRTPKLQRLQLTEKEDGTCQEVDLNSTIQERIAATNKRKEKERKRNQRKAKWSYLRVPKVLRKIS